MPTPRRLRPAAPPGLGPAAPLAIQRYAWRDPAGAWQTAGFTWAAIVLAGEVAVRPAIGSPLRAVPGDAYLVPTGAEVLLVSRRDAVEMRILADAEHAAGCLDRIAAAGGPRWGGALAALRPGPDLDRDAWARRAVRPVAPWIAEAFWWTLAAACGGGDVLPPARIRPPAWLAAAVAGCDSGDDLRAGVPALVRRSGRSAAHVNRAIRACYGCTATELINRLRMARAEHLLAVAGAGAGETARQVGFASRAHFHRLFSAAHGGCGPGAWRRAARR